MASRGGEESQKGVHFKKKGDNRGGKMTRDVSEKDLKYEKYSRRSKGPTDTNTRAGCTTAGVKGKS